jgi:UDP:flavonoid glycosyltransferase YjiC (YdhE family)
MSAASHRVLLAWEYGGHLGHVTRLSAVAEQLASLGAELAWAVPAPMQDHIRIGNPRATCFAAPRVLAARPTNEWAVHSFADVLANFGFADAATLRAAVSDWLTLFAKSRATRIVLDYAPVAQLAAFIAGLPTAWITNGFDAPPPECPVFGIAMRGPMLDRRNNQRVAEIDGAISEVANKLGRRGSARLRDTFDHPTRWYDCIPETDPYGPRSDGIYLGPLGSPHGLVPASWPVGPGPSRKVLVYLRSRDQLALTLGALPPTMVRVICVWPGAEPGALESLRREGAHLYGNPIDLNNLLAQCDAVVNYGSTGFVCRALLAGKPQLMWPTDVEKRLVSARVARLGAGTLVGANATPVKLRDCMAALLDSDGPARAAVRVASDRRVSSDALATACRAWLGGEFRESDAAPGAAPPAPHPALRTSAGGPHSPC